MSLQFSELSPEYAGLVATMKPTRANEIEMAARRIIRSRDRYLKVQKATGVPAAFVGVLNDRESSSNFNTGLGQGDPWSAPSIHVPKGKGPFASWESAAVWYLQYDGVTDNSAPWSMIYAAYKGEKWNGFGPRNHGIHTGYCWAGTNHYVKGKYVADGRWDPNYVDRQLGIMPVLKRIGEIDVTLAIDIGKYETTAFVSKPLPAPTGVNGEDRGVEWIQQTLNLLGIPEEPLKVDGSYGRKTARAVKAFQQANLDADGHPLAADGLAGPKTVAALGKAVGA